MEVYTLRLAQALAARGHDVLVLAAAHDLAAEPYTVRRREQDGVRVAEIVNVHHRGTLASTYDEPGLDAVMTRLLREFAPDCVHVQHLQNLSCGLLPAARAAGARVVLTLHDYWLSCPRDGLRMREDFGLCATIDPGVCADCVASSPYLVPPLQRGLGLAARSVGLGRHLHRLHDAAPRLTETALRLLRRARPTAAGGLRRGIERRIDTLREASKSVDVFVAPTSFARDRAVELGIAGEKTRVLALGALRHAPRPRPAGARRRFGFVGTLAPHKGIHVLIDAFRALSAPEVTLAVHGSTSVHPSYAASLARAAAGDPRIRFHGPFPEGNQERVLAELDLLVLPSLWWENSPLTILEALGAGRAVVASSVGGVPEIVPAGAGLLVPPGDAAALREALAALASGSRLAEARPALPLKTAAEGAAELEALYGEGRS